ncbi:glycoside hydrolase family 10 protein [Fuerstiella marisgermanici]|uniref:Glycosyl hydrolase-like 10 domain-containing protein n=1 Tax=Fuerstiella marisgermanici TaxID=1891926 RepID=A0A1P8WJL7_9PLAN|nr:family 10 glycosylhydrolase [Fuerstiella marisgermanici]APZ94243.1 hypothetical protein Fuma_03868 [Fuerstiella marisgermanici]
MNFKLFSLTLLLTAVSCRWANAEHTIDSFAYANDQDAQAAWSAREGTPDVRRIDEEGRPVLQVRAPFAPPNGLQRTVIDRDIKLDLTTPSWFTLDINVADIESVRALTFYFRSGKGWFSCGASLTRPGWKTLRFEKADFRAEESPSGWHAIDGIRIAVWKQNSRSKPDEASTAETSFRLRNLKQHQNDVAIVLPDQQDAGSAATWDAAKRIRKMLSELGIETDSLRESEIAEGALGSRRLAILPFNRPDRKACERLVEYLDQGGKLFLCYDVPYRLRNALGFAEAEFYRPAKGDSQLASIHFAPNKIDGLPNVVRQASWNVALYEPTGHNAHAIGTWYDKAGRSTQKAALLVSDKGAYFSHVILSDDWQEKKKMLAAVLGELDGEIWKTIATAQLQRAQQIGHCRSAEELRNAVSPLMDAEGRLSLDESDRDFAAARKMLSNKSYYASYQHAVKAEKQRLDVYFKAQPSPSSEARAFWEHSGVGPYPGDWDRTCRELADAGINMIIPNMLWAGVAHYQSEVLPRSAAYKKYGDQISQCLAAAKKHGLEVHVWKVNHNPGHYAPPEFIERMKQTGRTQVDVHGNVTEWLNPAHPVNFKLEVDSMLEVVRNYDVDGIHFDYIRYPNASLDYSDFSRRKFESDTGHEIIDWPADCYDGRLHDEYRDWRADQITRLVETVSREARKLRPDIKISAAVFSAYPQCREAVGQDWSLWAKRGYVDFLCPMNYSDNDDEFAAWITNQQKLAFGVPVYAGIGAAAGRSTLTADRVVGQIEITRQHKTGGFTIFALNQGTAASILPGLKAGASRNTATTPHRSTKQP